MRRQWLIVFGIELVIMVVVGGVLALISAEVLPTSLSAVVIVVGTIAAAIPIILVSAILPANTTRRVNALRQNGLPAMAEPLVEAQPLADAKMKGIGSYSGPEIFLELPVRVFPEDGTLPFEATMYASLFLAHFLRPGVRVAVKMNPQSRTHIALDDSMQEIVQRNPQLRREG